MEYNLYKKLYEALYTRGVIRTSKQICLLLVKINKSKRFNKFKKILTYFNKISGNLI